MTYNNDIWVKIQVIHKTMYLAHTKYPTLGFLVVIKCCDDKWFQLKEALKLLSKWLGYSC